MEILHPFFFIPLMASFMFLHPILASDPLSLALFSLKSELFDPANTLKDWLLPSQTQASTQILACSWSGVNCSHNFSKITSLDLSMKNLGGSLSGKQFHLFPDLTNLNLSHNNFSGRFPNGVSNLHNLVILDAFSNSFSGPLPPNISNLDSLRILNFAGSYFTGPIPPSYGSFKSLEFIHLAGNYLTGNIPPEFGTLKTLSHMEIGYNSYEGGIPYQFGNITNLQYLDIADANISGSIPETLSNLTNLESLFLFRNLLSGEIPFQLSRILTLQSLDLSDNRLSGTIPDSFSELKNLRLLSLMYNDLSGSVPQGIADLPQLDTLLIWSNFFTGSLPQDLGRSSNLQHVDVSTNYFTGGIPPDICSRGNLQKLILFTNNFTGGLSPSLSNCSSLVRLRLEDNSFSGEISLPFAKLEFISYVDLSRNKFTGGIPSDIALAYHLQYFNVSNNHELGGVIPIKMWSLSDLQNFSMVSCGVSSEIPAFEGCKSVTVVELRMNTLSGKIPQSVSNCKNLVMLDLARNNLTGLIPLELADLPAISTLDLSINSFSGSIPREFGNSSSLKLLNVSYNNISGPIPSNKAFEKMDQTAFLGNPRLCGAPLRPCGDENVLQLGSRRAQKIAWVLMLCGFSVLFVMSVIFGVFYFKRGSKRKWKVVAFDGLPQFTGNDVLRSFNPVEAAESKAFLPDFVGKVVLPTGITVSAKRIELKTKGTLRFLGRVGNVRHENLTRLLGVCYSDDVAYLLNDYMPNGSLAEKTTTISDWETKCSIVTSVAKGLSFLHHDCSLPIPHGNVKSSSVLFDENMVPHLSYYGLASSCKEETGGFGASVRDELDQDVFDFGGLVLEVFTGGGMTDSARRDELIRRISCENGAISRDDVKSVVEVALLCRTERPSMKDALKMLQNIKSKHS